MSLKLEDFSDPELLYALEDYADSDGLVSTHGLVEGLGLVANPNLKHPVSSVAIRLAWLKRYGIVRRDQESGRWGLTEIGQRVMHGRLSAAQKRLVEGLDGDDLLSIVQALGGRVVGASAESAKMAEREWRYSLAQRKRRDGR